jgi:Tol biopolymer transport system component
MIERFPPLFMNNTPSLGRFLFTTQGQTALMNSDGSGLRYLSFDYPHQISWQPVDHFSDGRRVLLLSMEERQDGPGRPFTDYYHQTRTHIWIYDLDSGELTEVEDRERLAPFYAPLLVLPGDERLLFQVVRRGTAQLFSMRVDGTERRELTPEGESFPYGLSLSPDGSRIAYHVSGPPPHNYRIFSANLDGSQPTVVAGQPDHLYFGTSWSPDGEWILYSDIHPRTDPGHDWANLCIGRPDVSEHRVLTSDASHWMSAAYGTPANYGNGSNMPRWMPDGSLLFSRKTPNAIPPWRYDANLPDDHFQRAFEPELSTGGSHLCLLNPTTGAMKPLTESVENQWDFRAAPQPDGNGILFCRAKVGETPSIWLTNSDGTEPRRLTQGIGDKGADHPRWLPLHRK